MNLFYGRTEIAVSYTEDELTVELVKGILEQAIEVHEKNVKEINYLVDYYKGKQDILKKTKKVRSDINNKTVENNAFHIVEFKKGYVFGDPIQYVQRADTDDEELTLLNAYMIDNDKSNKDKNLSEDLYVAGQGYRFVSPSRDTDVPFKINNLDNRKTFVVYSTDVEHTRLMGCYIMHKSNDLAEIMVYTRSTVYTFMWQKKKSSKEVHKIELLKEEQNGLGAIPIFEYCLNKNRLGLIELVKSGLDTLNKITSSDIDDIEQFIQSLLVFFNQDITKVEFIDMVELGAIMMSDQVGTNIKSDVKLLSQKLQHSETKVLYDRIYNNLLTICGVPTMSKMTSGGDTGQARLVGEGWIMADERAKQDELSFKIGERQMLKLALDICKVKPSSGISKMKTSDIEIKFTRNKSDNLLVKTQSLVNLKSAKVAPEIAFTVVGLFSDPAEVYKQCKAYYGDDFWKDEEVDVAPIVEQFAE